MIQYAYLIYSPGGGLLGTFVGVVRGMDVNMVARMLPPPDAHAAADARSGELDELTVRRAQRGDAQALHALIRHHQALVVRLTARILLHADPASIEDAAQDSFLAVLHALPNFRLDGSARLSSWIGSIATRRAIDLARKRRFVPLEKAQSVASLERADQAARRRQESAAICAAMELLPPEHRAVFILREYEGFDYQEIADVLEVPIGTVRSRLGRARAALREQLREFHRGF